MAQVLLLLFTYFFVTVSYGASSGEVCSSTQNCPNYYMCTGTDRLTAISFASVESEGPYNRNYLKQLFQDSNSHASEWPIANLFFTSRSQHFDGVIAYASFVNPCDNQECESQISFIRTKLFERIDDISDQQERVKPPGASCSSHFECHSLKCTNNACESLPKTCQCSSTGEQSNSLPCCPGLVADSYGVCKSTAFFEEPLTGYTLSGLKTGIKYRKLSENAPDNLEDLELRMLNHYAVLIALEFLFHDPDDRECFSPEIPELGTKNFNYHLKDNVSHKLKILREDTAELFNTLTLNFKERIQRVTDSNSSINSFDAIIQTNEILIDYISRFLNGKNDFSTLEDNVGIIKISDNVENIGNSYINYKWNNKYNSEDGSVEKIDCQINGRLEAKFFPKDSVKRRVRYGPLLFWDSYEYFDLIDPPFNRKMLERTTTVNFDLKNRYDVNPGSLHIPSHRMSYKYKPIDGDECSIRRGAINDPFAWVNNWFNNNSHVKFYNVNKLKCWELRDDFFKQFSYFEQRVLGLNSSNRIYNFEMSQDEIRDFIIYVRETAWELFLHYSYKSPRDLEFVETSEPKPPLFPDGEVLRDEEIGPSKKYAESFFHPVKRRVERFFPILRNVFVELIYYSTQLLKAYNEQNAELLSLSQQFDSTGGNEIQLGLNKENNEQALASDNLAENNVGDLSNDSINVKGINVNLSNISGVSSSKSPNIENGLNSKTNKGESITSSQKSAALREKAEKHLSFLKKSREKEIAKNGIPKSKLNILKDVVFPAAKKQALTKISNKLNANKLSKNKPKKESVVDKKSSLNQKNKQEQLEIVQFSGVNTYNGERSNDIESRNNYENTLSEIKRNKKKFKPNEDDSLFEKLSKAYFLHAYERLLNRVK